MISQKDKFDKANNKRSKKKLIELNNKKKKDLLKEKNRKALYGEIDQVRAFKATIDSVKKEFGNDG